MDVHTRRRAGRGFLRGVGKVLLAGLFFVSVIQLSPSAHVRAGGFTAGTETELANAIDTANDEVNHPGLDTITLTGNITLTANLPNITSAITIFGQGHFISGDDTWQVFCVDATGDLTLNAVSVQNGSAEWGGGILSYGRLRVTDSILANNSATNSGGGIYNKSILSITNSTLSGNQAFNHGGGIYNEDTVTVTGSTLVGNRAGREGGAIFNYDSLRITNSTLSGNQAGHEGGAIFNAIFSGVQLTNSTLADNEASSKGGGIINYGNTVTIANSIVAGNQRGTSYTHATADCTGMLIISRGHNVFGSNTGCPSNAYGDQSIAPADVFSNRWC